MKTFLLALATLIFTAIIVVGCSAPQPAESDSGNEGMYRDTWHKMPDGRTVYCMHLEQYSTGYAAGPIAFECDFANATVHK